MKFDLKHPDAEAGNVGKDEPEPCLVKFKVFLPCCICKSPTCWADLDFQGPICSDECRETLWNQYMEAVAKANARLEDAGEKLDI
jgi:hypothetical protein